MRDWTRPVIAIAIAMLAVVLAAELYPHLSVKPLAPRTLLFELLEMVFLVGCTVACMLLILRVRVREMAAATAAMLGVLLAGELYVRVKPVTAQTLLLELLEVALLVGGSIAFGLLALQ